MNIPAFLAPAILLAAASLSLAQAPDPDTLAARIVADSARIAEGETVLIRGHVRDQQLLEDIAIRARAAGAFPILSYASDHLTQGLADQVPDRFDNQLSALDIKLAPTLGAIITIDPTDNPSLLNHVPAPRLAERAKADAAYAALLRQLGVRQVGIGNGLYPTAANANEYSLSVNELSTIFWAAMAADPEAMHATGDMVRLVLSTGKELEITNPNGTSLKVKIEGRPSIVSDGTLPDPAAPRDRRTPQPLTISLPAGEVFMVPIAGSAEGKIVADNLAYRGRDITGLTLNFKAGKMTGMNAKSNMDALRPLYDAAGPGKDVLSFLDIGVNPDVKLPAGVKPCAPMPLGMISINIGNSTRAGGDNTCPFNLLLPLPGSTVKVDGTILIDSGTLVMPVSPLPSEEPMVGPEPAEHGEPAPTGH